MSDSPYELQRLVTVRTFSTPWEAQIAQARLGSEGLHSLIANEHVIRMVALSNAVGGIQLKVREQDAEAAAAVLGRLAPLPEIYLVGQDAAAAGAPSVPILPEANVPVASAAGVPALLPAGVLSPPPAGMPPGDAGSPSCPSCGGFDLRPERSARLVLGVLPISRRAYRCGDCGSLWRLEEIGGTPRLEDGFAEAGAAAPGPGEHGGQGDDTALSTVARFHTPWEAHLARSFLESEGLRCCVLEERLPAVHLLSAEPVAYNRLEVRRADAARAAEILARAWSYPSLVAIPDPDAGGLDAAGPDHDAGADPGEGPDVDRDSGDPAAGR
jgi:Putative prokaryotic signal transducing protein